MYRRDNKEKKDNILKNEVRKVIDKWNTIAIKIILF